MMMYSIRIIKRRRHIAKAIKTDEGGSTMNEKEKIKFEKIKFEIETIKQMHDVLIYSISILNRDLEEVSDLINQKLNQK